LSLPLRFKTQQVHIQEALGWRQWALLGGRLACKQQTEGPESQSAVHHLHRLLQITFTTSDGQTFKVDEEVAKQFGTVRLMLEGTQQHLPAAALAAATA
jgi:hypothetical protein